MYYHICGSLPENPDVRKPHEHKGQSVEVEVDVGEDQRDHMVAPLDQQAMAGEVGVNQTPHLRNKIGGCTCGYFNTWVGGGGGGEGGGG